jgi:hypothetical protein
MFSRNPQIIEAPMHLRLYRGPEHQSEKGGLNIALRGSFCRSRKASSRLWWLGMGPGDKVSLACAFKFFVFLSARPGLVQMFWKWVWDLEQDSSIFCFPCRQPQGLSEQFLVSHIMLQDSGRLAKRGGFELNPSATNQQSIITLTNPQHNLVCRCE